MFGSDTVKLQSFHDKKEQTNCATELKKSEQLNEKTVKPYVEKVG